MNQRLTVGQALLAFLRQQYVSRDGREHSFFAGCFGIFGHGNVAGFGQALHQTPSFRYIMARNEQAMVHAAVAYAKQSNRLRTFACTSSIGPGATNMVTGAALATINRIPVLLLPGDIFVRRTTAPVLQQLEMESTQDISVNDCFRPISRYWDRIQHPEQLISALPEVMRVLTSPADTGAVTLALPQDVQAEAFDFPEEFFRKWIWHIPRPRGDEESIHRAVEVIGQACRPLIIAGGGVLYSEATEELRRFAAQTGIPVAETQAGKGSMPYDHPSALGAIGVTGTPGANALARDADVVIGIGTRYADFTTQSKTLFQNPNVYFVNVNVAGFDAYKHAAIPIVADARVAIEELATALQGYSVSSEYRASVARHQREWDLEVERVYTNHNGLPLSQAEVIGLLNSSSQPGDVVVNAAGSLPGDLHKLWRTRDAKGYHMEYGYSCMGYEIAGGLGVKLAAPDREVYVLVGDASYLMMAQELVTAVQEEVKLIVVLLDNHGYMSINGLSHAVGVEGYGTTYRYQNDGRPTSDLLPVDFAANAASLGARIWRARTLDEVSQALDAARAHKNGPCVVVVETSFEARVGSYGTWWDVPVAEVAETESARQAYLEYAAGRSKERYLGIPSSAPAAEPLIEERVSAILSSKEDQSCDLEASAFKPEDPAIPFSSVKQ
jgi:3D-(3,5/4)-trihydroxycyclohexane-1,2-dione acylhydrolase (decyclizing)